MLVVTFIGILATFVVVGNYMQVKNIRDDFTEKIDEIMNVKSEIDKYKSFLEKKGGEKAIEIVMNLKYTQNAKEEIEKLGGWIFPAIENYPNSENNFYQIVVYSDSKYASIIHALERFKVDISTEKAYRLDITKNEYETMPTT